MDHDAICILLKRLSRPDGSGGAVIERGQYDSANALTNEAFHHLDLPLAFVFAQGALPDYFDVRSLGCIFTGSFVGASVNAFPKLVSSAFGDHGDRKLFARRLSRLSTTQ